MITIDAKLTTIGQLAAQAVNGNNGDGAGSHGNSGGVVGRLPGVVLQNDGCHYVWLPSMGSVVLEHNGTAWAVTFPEQWWTKGHSYRLLVDELPMADGSSVPLERGSRYQIRYSEARAAWDLHLDASPLA